MKFIIAFLAAFLSEVGWICYVRGVAHRRLALALIGNVIAIVCGATIARAVVEDVVVLPALVAGGCTATLALWRREARMCTKCQKDKATYEIHVRRLGAPRGRPRAGVNLRTRICEKCREALLAWLAAEESERRDP